MAIRTMAWHINEGTDATEVTLTKLQSNKVLGPNAELMQIAPICTNKLNYVKLTSPSLPNAGIKVGPSKATGFVNLKGQMPNGAEITAVAKQTSGGNIDIATSLTYSSGPRKPLVKGKPVSVLATCTGGADSQGSKVSVTGLNTEKRFCLVGYQIEALTLQEMMILSHPDFAQDLWLPSWGIFGTPGNSDPQSFLLDPSDLPHFRAEMPLDVSVYGVASTCLIYLNLIEY